MKKGLAKILLLVSMLFVLTCIFTACNETPPEHVHNYSIQSVNEEFLSSQATCTKKAKYFYSCECGEKSNVTFEVGETLAHTFDKQVETDEYLSSQATCTKKAKYFYSCECGEKSTETFDVGEVLEHTFDKKVATEEYIYSQATTTEFARYYFSCECGLKGEITFAHGELLKGLQYQLVNNEYTVTGYTGTETHVVIPAEYQGYPVTSIGMAAFFAIKTQIVSVEIPNTVTSIGKSAFSNCKSLTSINIPDSVLTIGEQAFADCEALEFIKIPDSVVQIGQLAFYNCELLERIVIPKTIENTDLFGPFHKPTYIFFNGTREEAIDFLGILYEDITYFYVENESDLPNDGGKYWHYVNGEPTVWE